jgi:hypothetical protein
MHWNHRLVQMHQDPNLDPWVQVMEAYYNDDGSIGGFCEVCLGSEYPNQIPEVLKRILDDITRNPDVVLLDSAVGLNGKSSEPF